MTLNRRKWLQGALCVGTAIAAKSTSTVARASESSGAGKFHMPPDLGSPVTGSLRPVIENSRDVQTHYNKIVEVARWMAYEDLPLPNLAIPYGLEKTPATPIDFCFVG